MTSVPVCKKITLSWKRCMIEMHFLLICFRKMLSSFWNSSLRTVYDAPGGNITKTPLRLANKHLKCNVGNGLWWTKTFRWTLTWSRDRPTKFRKRELYTAPPSGEENTTLEFRIFELIYGHLESENIIVDPETKTTCITCILVAYVSGDSFI